jgi:ribosomal protein L11 methylase PrmA
MMLEATDGRYFYAPVGDNPQRIADLGTGTGIWAIEGMLNYSEGVARRGRS